MVYALSLKKISTSPYLAPYVSGRHNFYMISGDSCWLLLMLLGAWGRRRTIDVTPYTYRFPSEATSQREKSVFTTFHV